MGALIRYHLAAVLHGQRYLGPLLFLAVVLTVFTVNDQGPLTGSYVAASAAGLLTSCWLTITIVNHEDPVRRSVTAVLAGGPDRVLLAEVTLALLAGLAVAAAGLVVPIFSGHHDWSGADLAAGSLALLTATLSGTAAGVLSSRLVVPRPGWSLLCALVVTIGLALVPGLPPVNPMLRTLAGTTPASGQVPALAVDLGIAVVLLVVGVAVARFIAARRD